MFDLLPALHVLHCWGNSPIAQAGPGLHATEIQPQSQSQVAKE